MRGGKKQSHETRAESDGEDESRRNVLKTTGALAAGGALGTLAGCTGSDNSQEESPAGQDESSEEQQDSPKDQGGGNQETVTVNYWSQEAAETPQSKQYFKESMRNFESMHENIKVNLNAVSSSAIRDQLIPAVQGGNPPDAAQGGVIGKQWWDSGKVIDHASYIEEADDLPQSWSAAHKEAMQFRDSWWAAGTNKMPATISALRPKFFKEVGVEDPSELETWTGWRRAVEKIDEQFNDVWAYEETGSPGDLESYWGYARTAYRDGVDPWMEGKPSNLNLKVGQESATDGMMKNAFDLANAYSSPKSASRTNEAIPSLMLTDKVASFHYSQGRASDWTNVKQDATFGWDGDIYGLPIPRLDPNYGEEFGIEELAGVEGNHGGHVWTLEPQKFVFEASDKKDAAWDVCYYTNCNKEHIVPFLTEINTSPPSYMPYFDEVRSRLKEQYGGEVPQIFDPVLSAFDKYDSNFKTTGGAWQVFGVSKLRWTDLNETISQAIAGQIKRDQLPTKVRNRMTKTLNNRNENIQIS